jgi:hypothetical protein
MKLFTPKITFLLLLCLALSGCTEQYVIQTNTFDEALVVEATITNELKKQEIKLSRTFRFEQDGPVPEAGAQVSVTDSDGNEYTFSEDSGRYVSDSQFQAAPGKTYRLRIITHDGKIYDSDGVKMTTVNEIQSVTPVVKTINSDKGVAIMVSSFDASNTSKYYRYEYEETYKIIAPQWSPDKAVLIPAEPGASHEEIAVVPRTNGESRTCYNTNYTSDILLANTAGLIEDRVNFQMRFISIQNPIITHRYSILVRQYIQSLASYTFYRTLKQMSGNESILSQNQPGFFYGNLHSVSNPNEKVVGFFDVSSVSSRRIFFNFDDLFPDEPKPPYFDDCELKRYGFCFVAENPDCKGPTLLSDIRTNSMLYVRDFYYIEGGYQVYNLVAPACGDCTKISSNVIPSFWID